MIKNSYSSKAFVLFVSIFSQVEGHFYPRWDFGITDSSSTLLLLVFKNEPVDDLYMTQFKTIQLDNQKSLLNENFKS